MSFFRLKETAAYGFQIVIQKSVMPSKVKLFYNLTIMFLASIGDRYFFASRQQANISQPREFETVCWNCFAISSFVITILNKIRRVQCLTRCQIYRLISIKEFVPLEYLKINKMIYIFDFIDLLKFAGAVPTWCLKKRLKE